VVENDDWELKIFRDGGPYDRKDPRSLYNIMPKECRPVLDNMPITLLTMDEPHLEAAIKPTPYLNHLRRAFWMEYDMAQNTVTNMSLSGIQKCLGNNSPSILLREYLLSEKSLAWVLIPPTHYDSLIEEALNRGMRRLNQILDMPMVHPDGSTDHKAAEIILKAVAFLDIRKNGMPTQNITQDVRQLSVSVTSSEAKKLGMLPRSEELDLKIKKLEERLKLEAK
jgi:hypothetical protein